MFPLDYRGELSRSKLTVSEPDKFPADFLLRSTRVLQQVRARDITIDGQRISFIGGVFRFVWNWNILEPIGYGHIDLNETDDSFVVSYYVSFRQLFVIASALVLIFGLDLFRNDHMPVGAKLGFIVFAWFFLVGGNWLIAMVRFPSFVNSMLWGGDRI
jgi:hypothetical protein